MDGRNSIEAAQIDVSPLAAKKSSSPAAADATEAPATAEGATAALSIHNLVKEYVAGRPVLRGISLEFASHGITAVIGPSGSGKSTLIRCINRLVEPTSGEIVFEGRDLATARDKRELRDARRHIGMVFQEYNLVERLTVMENVLCGRLGYVTPARSMAATVSARATSTAPSISWRPWDSAPSRTRAPTASPADSASASASHAR